MSNQLVNLGLPLITLLVLLFPFMYRKKHIDPFEPLCFFTIAFFWGGFLRSLWLLNDASARSIYRLTVEDIHKALAFTLLGFIFFQIGYLHPLATVIAKKIPPFSFPHWNQKRFLISMGFLLAFGFFFLIYFIDVTGGVPTDLYLLSYKRRIANNYICWGAGLLSTGSILYLVHIYKDQIHSLKTYLLLLVLVVWACLFPLLSSRGLEIMTLLYILILYSHYLSQRLTLKRILILSGIGTFLFLLMLQFRQASHTGTLSLHKAIAVDTTASFFVESHYFFDITTASLIVKYVPDIIEYQQGKTLTNWLLFPIPRSVWASKPENLGRILSDKLYFKQLGIRTGGIAPPFLFELYLNFHIIGIAVGMLIFGIVSKSLYLRLLYSSNPITLVLHALNLRFLYGLFIRDLTWNLVMYFQWLLPLLFFLFFVTHGKKNGPGKSIHS